MQKLLLTHTLLRLFSTTWRNRRKMVVLLLLMACGMTAVLHAQTQYREVTFDEEDGLPHSHVTQLLQDGQGLMWFATWNGLCRYDGYEFRTFKPAVGDGCAMTTDRFRDIALRPDGNILCRVDDGYFCFDTRTCTFRNLTESERNTAADDIKNYRNSISTAVPGRIYFSITDRQGNVWSTTQNGLTCRIAIPKNSWRLDITPKAQVKCLFADRQGRYWVSTRDDSAVRVYSAADDRLLGYLGKDGRLHAAHTSFGSPVYGIFQDKDGALWLCTKPDGLYRLRETAGQGFTVEHIEGVHSNVYYAVQDSRGRLWVATLGGGLLCCDKPQESNPVFRVPKGFPIDKASRLRYLHLTRDGKTLLAAGTECLVIASLMDDKDKMTFRMHQRESDRAESLSSSATMDIVEDFSGRIYISTESGGINVLEPQELLAEHPRFMHLSLTSQHLSNDVVMAMAAWSDQDLMVVGGHIVTLLPFKTLNADHTLTTDPSSGNRVLDSRFFGESHLRFSDAHPLPLPGGRWLIGLTDGAVFTADSLIKRRGYCPPLLVTGINIQGSDDLWNVTYADSLVLQPHQRSVTIHFAALDYTASEHISYAFRMDTDKEWSTLGTNHTLTLLDLEPGTYLLQLRSTNANGEWQDNIRTLTLRVTPTFWESIWGKLLILTLIVLVLAAIVATVLYIRRIKRKQKETLQAYLAMLERNDNVKGNGNEAAGGFLPTKRDMRHYEDENEDEDEDENGNVNGNGSSVGVARENTHEKAGTPVQPVYPERVESSAGAAAPVIPSDPMLDRVMQFIEQNIGNSDASVGDMAQAAATSRSGLQRKLKHAMGITPQDLLREARIKHACRLLTNTDRSVAEVAYSCGFSDPKYFSRCFKQSVGLSPTDYRTQQS